MKFFRFFRRPKVDPMDFAEKLCDTYGEENLKVLNSCEGEDFKLTLVREFLSSDLIVQFKDLEDAVAQTKIIIEAANHYLKAPITEKELVFFCKCLTGILFYEKL